MTKKLTKYSLIALITVFMIQGCKEKNNDPITPNTPTNTASVSYLYKGMLVGSTGHVTVTLTTAGDTTDATKKGAGKVDLTMDGQKHTLTSSSDQLAKFQKGEKLDTVKFSDDKGVKAEVSVDKNGEIKEVKMTMDGHSNIAVAMFKEEDKSKVEVFEGIAKTYLGENVSADNPVLKEENFNLIIKGDSVKVMQKTYSFKGQNCNTLSSESEKKMIMDQSLSTVKGTVKVQGNNYAITITIPGGHSRTSVATRDGDKLTGNKIPAEGICVVVKKLDHTKAYYDVATSEGTKKAYKVMKDGVISTTMFIPCDAAHGCLPTPTGYTPVDAQGVAIAEGNSTYYKDARGESDKKGYALWTATKTL